MQFRTRMIDFFKGGGGTITVTLALMFPAIIGLYSIAIDGGRFNTERARLNDSLNQGVYGLAVDNNQNETNADKQQNVNYVKQYMAYYFPGKTIDSKLIDVTVKNVVNMDGKITGSDYHVNADVISHPFFYLPENGSGGFSKNVKLRGDDLSGTVRRSTSSTIIPGDFVFVTDFSTSMLDHSAQPGYTREQLLKKVVHDIGAQILEQNNGSTIGIVPFAAGVPVKMDKANYIGPSSKEYGCSFIGKLKDGYDNVDLRFWYNKPRFKDYGYGDNITTMISHTDEGLRHYYVNAVAAANGYYGEDAYNWLVDKGYCRVDNNISEHYTRLLCDGDPASDIHNESNRAEYEKNFDKFMALSKYEQHTSNIINQDTMDINKTLSGDYLFKINNVQKFVTFMNAPEYTPFSGDCVSAAPINLDGYYTDSELKTLYNSPEPKYYTIELTDNSNVISEYQSMRPSGGTNSLAGLLGAVPILAQGKNKRKIMFVITDGEDSYPNFRHELMTQYQLCNVILDGLKKYPDGTPTTSSDIYYISLVQNATAGEWAKYCVGEDHSYIATNLDELMDVILGAIHDESIQYVNPDE